MKAGNAIARRRTPALAGLVLLVPLATLALLPSCVSTPESLALPATAQTATARADENDIDASVEVAVGLHEMAVVRTIKNNADPQVVRVYELRTVTDEPAYLEVRREGSGSSSQPAPLTLRASVGAFGDAKREAALLQSVRRRLMQLAGVEIAPIR